MADINHASRRRIAKEWSSISKPEQIILLSTWGRLGVCCDVCGARGYYRENCKNGCIHSQQIEKEEKNSINANDETDRKDDNYNIDNVMRKNEGNHGNYDVDYLSYVDSNFDRDDKSLDISPTPLSLLNFDMDHMPDSSNGSNNNDNNDAYNSNNCDRIGIGVLWGDMQSGGIMDNDNDVDKNLKKKKKKKLGIESSKLLSIEEKKKVRYE